MYVRQLNNWIIVLKYHWSLCAVIYLDLSNPPMLYHGSKKNYLFYWITNCITLTVICQAMKTGSMLSDCLYRIKNWTPKNMANMRRRAPPPPPPPHTHILTHSFTHIYIRGIWSTRNVREDRQTHTRTRARTHTHTDRQTDRHTHRHTGRQTDTQTDTHTHRHTHRHS